MTILIFDINLENVSRHVHSSFALAVLRSGRSPDPRLRGTRGGAGAVRSALILTQGRPQEGFALRRLPVDDGPQILYHLRSEEHTSELQSRENLVSRLLLE